MTTPKENIWVLCTPDELESIAHCRSESGIDEAPTTAAVDTVSRLQTASANFVAEPLHLPSCHVCGTIMGLKCPKCGATACPTVEVWRKSTDFPSENGQYIVWDIYTQSRDVGMFYRSSENTGHWHPVGTRLWAELPEIPQGLRVRL